MDGFKITLAHNALVAAIDGIKKEFPTYQVKTVDIENLSRIVQVYSADQPSRFFKITVSELR